MEFKGTKGEWCVNKPEDSNGYVYVDSDETTAGGVMVCYDDRVAMANAKLIAAAPDLLKALQETEKDLCVLWGQVKNLEETNPIAEGLSSLIQDWRDRNKKAINKALK